MAYVMLILISFEVDIVEKTVKQFTGKPNFKKVEFQPKFMVSSLVMLPVTVLSPNGICHQHILSPTHQKP